MKPTKTMGGSMLPWKPKAQYTGPLYSLQDFIEATQGVKLNETQRFVAGAVERISDRFDGLIDRAALAALASGIPQSELWLEHRDSGLDARLMRHAAGAPRVGEMSRGEVVARVWMEPLDLRVSTGRKLKICYEGIDIGEPAGAEL